jgi:hypothetical protein
LRAASTINRLFILRTESHAAQLYAFLKNNWRAMADQEKPLAVTVTEAKSKRSLEQNGRYWSMLIEQTAAQAWVNGERFSKAAWHEHFARKFIGIEKLPSGEITAISTTTLNVEQFAEYMNKVETEAVSELGVVFQE